MPEKPKFDVNKPFEAVDGKKPAFNPDADFTPVEENVTTPKPQTPTLSPTAGIISGAVGVISAPQAGQQPSTSELVGSTSGLTPSPSGSPFSVPQTPPTQQPIPQAHPIGSELMLRNKPVNQPPLTQEEKAAALTADPLTARSNLQIAIDPNTGLSTSQREKVNLVSDQANEFIKQNQSLLDAEQIALDNDFVPEGELQSQAREREIAISRQTSSIVKEAVGVYEKKISDMRQLSRDYNSTEATARSFNKSVPEFINDEKYRISKDPGSILGDVRLGVTNSIAKEYQYMHAIEKLNGEYGAQLSPEERQKRLKSAQSELEKIRSERVSMIEERISVLQDELSSSTNANTRKRLQDEIDYLKNSFGEKVFDPKKTAQITNTYMTEDAANLIDVIPDNLSSKEKFDVWYYSLIKKQQQLESEIDKQPGGWTSLPGEWFSGISGGLSENEKKYYENRRLLNSLFSVYMLNEFTPDAEKGFFDGFMSNLIGGISPSTGQQMPFETQRANDILQVTSDIGISNEMNPLATKGITTAGTPKGMFTEEFEFWNPGTWDEVNLFEAGQTAGTLATYGIDYAIGSKTFGALAKGLKWAVGADKIAKYSDAYASYIANSPRIVKWMGDALEEGAKFEVTGEIFKDKEDEFNFVSGFLGSFVGERAKAGAELIIDSKLVDKIYNYTWKVFGNSAPQVMRVLSDIGDKATAMGARGTGELFEETTQELVGIWQSTDNGEQFMNELRTRFGSLSAAQEFVVTSFAMGAVFGMHNNTDAFKKKYLALSPEEREQIAPVLSEINQEAVAASAAVLTDMKKDGVIPEEGSQFSVTMNTDNSGIPVYKINNKFYTEKEFVKILSDDKNIQALRQAGISIDVINSSENVSKLLTDKKLLATSEETVEQGLIEQTEAETSAETNSAINELKKKYNIGELSIEIPEGEGGQISVTVDGEKVDFKNFALTIDGNDAYVANVEIADKTVKGVGTLAYIELGRQLAERGITLRSTDTLKADGAKLWARLESLGFAKRTGSGKYEFVSQVETTSAETSLPVTETTVQESEGVEDKKKKLEDLKKQKQDLIEQYNRATDEMLNDPNLFSSPEYHQERSKPVNELREKIRDINKQIKDISETKTETIVDETKTETTPETEVLTPSRELTPEEQTINDNLSKDLTENYDERKKEYIEKNGLVFDTDRAREFSPEYRDNPALYSNATQIPAREFVTRMYNEELKKPAPEGKRNAVSFMAGGSGVGKTIAIDMMGVGNDAHISVDTNLSNFDRATENIDDALANGKEVSITFVYRPPVESFINKEGGVIARAKKEGRTVDYNIGVEIHRKALETIKKLAEHYKDNPNVSFAYLNNSFESGEAKQMSLEDVEKISDDYESAKKEIRDEIERQYAAGELSESLYKGLIGTEKSVRNEPERISPTAGKQNAGGVKQKKQEQGEATEPPVAEPPVPETEQRQPPPPGEKERLFAGQVIEDENIRQEIKDRLKEKNYIPTTNDINVSEAQAYIDTQGPVAARQAIFDLKNDMPFRTRVVIGKMLIKFLNNQASKAPKEQKAAIYDEAADIADSLAKMGTELGQGVQAFSLWGQMSLEGMIITISRRYERAKKESRENNKETRSNVNKAANEAAEAAARLTASNLSEEGKKKSKKTKTFGLTSEQISERKKKALERLKKALKRPPLTSGGIDPEVITAAAEYGFYLFAEGVRNFTDWAKGMKEAGIEDDGVLNDVWHNHPVSSGKTMAQLAKIGGIVDVISNNYTSGGDINSLTKSLMDSFGLSEQEAKGLAKEIDNEFKKKYSKEKKKKIKDATSDLKSKSSRKAIKRLMEGEEVIDQEMINRVFDEEFGITEEGIPQDLIDRLQDLDQQRSSFSDPDSFAANRVTVEMLNEIHERMNVSSWKDKIGLGWAIWYANTLSGPETQILNFVSNVINTQFEAAVSVLPRLYKDKNLSGVAGMYLSLFKGMMDGFMEGEAILKEGPTTVMREMSKWEVKTDLENWKTGKYNPFKQLKYVGRFMSATDAVFYIGARRMRLYEQVRNELISKGFRGEELEAEIQKKLGEQQEVFDSARSQAKQEMDAYYDAAKLDKNTRKYYRDVARRTSEILFKNNDVNQTEEAETFGRTVTFNYTPKGWLGSIAAGLKWVNTQVPPMRLYIPFINVPFNIVNQSLDYTPYGYARALGVNFSRFTHDSDKSTRVDDKGSEFRNREIIKATFGTIMMTGLFALAAMYDDDDENRNFFDITGKGPSDYNKRSQELARGVQPYSIKIGDKYISYQYSPLLMPLAWVGNWRDHEKYKELGEKEWSTKFAFMVQNSMSSVFDLSSLQGMNALFEIVSSASTPEVMADKVFKMFGKTTTSLVVPNLVRQIDNLFVDRTIYETSTVQAAIISQIPFASHAAGLKPKLNALGEPIEREDNIMRRFVGNLNPDPAWLLIGRKKATIPGASPDSKNLDGSTMTDDQFYTYVKRSGELLKEYISSHMDDLELLEGGGKDSEFEKYIKKMMNQFRTQAKLEIYEKMEK